MRERNARLIEERAEYGGCMARVEEFYLRMMGGSANERERSGADYHLIGRRRSLPLAGAGLRLFQA